MAVLALLALLGGNPWNLRCAAMPAEAPAPAALRADVRAAFPWVPSHDDGAIRAGPVWLFALSSRTAVSRDGDGLDGHGRSVHRVVVAVGPRYARRVVLRGAALAFTRGTSPCLITGRPTWCARVPLREAPALRIPAGRGWRVVRTALVLGRTGCLHVRATGAALDVTLPLAVPG